jgi:ferritin-like metal-binding protein YciE
MATKVSTLEDLYVDQLKDLYSAETQLVKALPQMSEAADSGELKRAFDQHLAQTRNQVSRLEEIFTDHQNSPRGKKCVGMEGLIKEGEEALHSSTSGPVRDAALIAAAQKVEHYEISGYGTARAYAQILGYGRAINLLSQTLDEEAQADQKLTQIAESQVNLQAMG